jgi:hypothetical protein
VVSAERFPTGNTTKNPAAWRGFLLAWNLQESIGLARAGWSETSGVEQSAQGRRTDVDAVGLNEGVTETRAWWLMDGHGPPVAVVV